MFDYKQRLTSAINALQTAISKSLNWLTSSSSSPSGAAPQVYVLTNISETLVDLSKPNTHGVVIYNPIAHARQEWIRIPVANKEYTLQDYAGNTIKQFSLIPIASKVKQLIGHRSEVTHELVFQADLPALGFTTFFLSNKDGNSVSYQSSSIESDENNHFVLKGKGINFLVDNQTGKLRYAVKNGVQHRLNQEFLYYQSGRSSSYEFCPTGGAVDLTDYASTVERAAKYNGTYEIVQKVNDWITQTIRVYEDREYVELDFVIGPISDEYKVYKDIISRIDTDLDSENVFYTDANGRQNVS